MYKFLLNLWMMHRLTVEQVDAAVMLGRITEAQGDTIKETPR
jgi:hypothetical protein